MKKQNSSEKLGFLLQKIMKVLHAQGRKVLTEENLTFPQYYALSLLIKKGFLKMSDLKEKLFITGAGATGIADHLVKKGLAQRQRSTDDRRVVNIRITDKGAKIIERALRQRRDYLASVLKKIEPDKKDLLIKGVEIFASVLEEDI
ncbi:MAG TPA: MarR family transcriptional regulator [Bacteroidetes bacterium]|nr:MarR family transcriptional regulator [Bacteroidota bacterium]